MCIYSFLVNWEGAFVVMIVWWVGLQLHVQSVHITTNLVKLCSNIYLRLYEQCKFLTNEETKKQNKNIDAGTQFSSVIIWQAFFLSQILRFNLYHKKLKTLLTPKLFFFNIN
jgi:threonine/homoserine/homoserine lactone efflux protein